MQAILIRHDTKAWKAQVWISFFVATLVCATGLGWLPGRDLDRAFMMMGYLFCVSAAFALAKFVRDNERRARRACAPIAAIALAFACSASSRAQSTISDVSALSALPIAVSVAAPVDVLSAGAALTVVAVEATSTGAVWVLARASDGARASVRLVGRGVAGASIAAGTVVLASALSTGWVLSAAGQAICFIPNELGRSLLYNERITR
ncbi:MAG TPA: YiaA/YiaB family inner membrane protein [Caldimonas sp.]